MFEESGSVAVAAHITSDLNGRGAKRSARVLAERRTSQHLNDPPEGRDCAAPRQMRPSAVRRASGLIGEVTTCGAARERAMAAIVPYD